MNDNFIFIFLTNTKCKNYYPQIASFKWFSKFDTIIIVMSCD